MNLVETLIGGVVFAVASMGSLRIYASSVQATQGLHQRQEHDTATELTFAAVHRSLSLRSEAGSPGGAGDSSGCAVPLVQPLLAAAAGGTEAAVQISQHEGLLRVVVQISDQPSRQRWFSPAAYGLCGNPSDAASP